MLSIDTGAVHLISINYLDGGAEYTLSEFANDAISGGVIDVSDDCAAIQRDCTRSGEMG